MTSKTSHQVAFDRGALGFVAIDNADSTWSGAFTTFFPDESYCAVASEIKCPDGTCLEAAHGMSSTSATLSMPTRSAIGLHTGQAGTGSSAGLGPGTVFTTFNCIATTDPGENIFITGSIPQLSNWSTTSAIYLSPASYPIWSVTIKLPVSTNFQYKYIRIKNGVVTWEYDPTRSYTTSNSNSVMISDSWDGPAV